MISEHHNAEWIRILCPEWYYWIIQLKRFWMAYLHSWSELLYFAARWRDHDLCSFFLGEQLTQMLLCLLPLTTYLGCFTTVIMLDSSPQKLPSSAEHQSSQRARCCSLCRHILESCTHDTRSDLSFVESFLIWRFFRACVCVCACCIFKWLLTQPEG